MIVATAPPRRYLEYGLIASLLLHTVAAGCFPAFRATSPDQTIETIALVHLERVVIERPRPVIAVRRAAAPVRSLTPRVADIRRSPSHRSTTRLSKATVAVLPPAAAPVIGAAASGSVASAAGDSQATATPQPVQQVANVPRPQPAGYMPFGVDVHEPVLDPGVLKALAALNVHVTLVVTVDDNGKTKQVAFQPPLDTATEARIKALLADANWDPSVCGAGLPCEGSTTIKL